MGQGRWRVADQALAAFTDVGKVDLPGHRRPLQTKDQSWNVGGDPLQPRLAFLQRGQRPTALGDVIEVDHQVLAVAKTQETQRNVRRQNAAVGPYTIGFETLWCFLTGPVGGHPGGLLQDDRSPCVPNGTRSMVFAAD